MTGTFDPSRPFSYVAPHRWHWWRRWEIVEYKGRVVPDSLTQDSDGLSVGFTAIGPLTKTVHARRFWLLWSVNRYLRRLKAERGVSDLVTWLRQQLEEDVQIARAAARAFAALGTEAVAEWLPVMLQTEHSSRVDEHIARWDPARVLAEVEAKRRILDRFEEAVKWYSENRSAPAGEVHGLRTAVELLALPYADRDGYDEAWRP